VFREVNDAWTEFGPADRQTAHLACTANVDRDENSVIVNALQRRADVVVQKAWPKALV
jgi:hypothetical protein